MVRGPMNAADTSRAARPICDERARFIHDVLPQDAIHHPGGSQVPGVLRGLANCANVKLEAVGTRMAGKPGPYDFP